MMLFAIILLFFGISMAMMALGHILSDKPLERGCGRLASGSGPCDCRNEADPGETCRYRRKPRGENS